MGKKMSAAEKKLVENYIKNKGITKISGKNKSLPKGLTYSPTVK